MSLFKPIYTSFDSVKVRLANKVQFQSEDPALDGELPNQLLAQLIVDAETSVEQKLRTRYAIPFRSKRTGYFKDLPDHSQRAIRRAVDMAAVMEVLRTDFGRGTHVSGDAYAKDTKDAFDKAIIELLGRDPEGDNDKHDRFRFAPPLDDLMLAASNREADDGYKGMIINTDSSHRDAVTYAGEQVNNPAATYINRRLDNGAL